jgi:hypothetical protein
MKLTLEAGKTTGLELPLEVESISPSGLVVLSADRPPTGFDERLLGSPQESEPLRFVLEKDGRQVTLQASLVWFEVSSDHPDVRRLELIVDAGDQPGWWEVHTAVNGD